MQSESLSFCRLLQEAAFLFAPAADWIYDESYSKSQPHVFVFENCAHVNHLRLQLSTSVGSICKSCDYILVAKTQLSSDGTYINYIAKTCGASIAVDFAFGACGNTAILSLQYLHGRKCTECSIWH